MRAKSCSKTPLRLGAAIDFDSAAAELHGLFTDSVTTRLLASPGPDSIRTAGLAITPAVGRLAFDVRSPPDSVVLAIEAQPLHTPTSPAASMRRGWSPPTALQHLPSDSLALSDLLLVRLPADCVLPTSLAFPFFFAPYSSRSRSSRTGATAWP